MSKMAAHAKILLVVVLASPAGIVSYAASYPNSSSTRAPESSSNNLPLVFEPNQGQFESSVKFASRVPGFGLYLTRKAAVLSLDSGVPRNFGSPRLAPQDTHKETTSIRFIGASHQFDPEPLDRLPGVSNYLLGKDRSAWRTGIAQYGQVRYRSVYPGIDATFYGNARTLEYDFELSPGADPASIRIAFDRVRSLRVNSAGDLILQLGDREFVQRKPTAYQEQDGQRVNIAAVYRIGYHHSVSIQVGEYDSGRPLTIDPVVQYGTFLGGAGVDGANSIAIDAQGSAYIAGYTTSFNMPGAGASVLQPFLNGTADAFIAKLNPGGSSLAYMTYLGGSGEDEGISVALDSAGDVIVCGITTSSDFPVQGASYAGTPALPYGGGPEDGFLSILNNTGTALLFSTYLGGVGDDVATALTVDPSDNVYVAGYSSSPSLPGIGKGAAQENNAGGYDMFVIKVNNAGQFVYGTFIGGSGDETASAIAVSAGGIAYIAGDTTSATVPFLGSSRKGSPRDAIVEVLSVDGASVLATLDLSGSGDQSASGVAVDGNGAVYIAGTTNSLNFPVSSATLQNQNHGSYDAFVAVITDPLANSAPPLIFSTLLGGSGLDSAYSLALGVNGGVYVAGYTNSTDFLPALPEQPAPGQNTFVVEFTPVLVDGPPQSPPLSPYNLAFAGYLPSPGAQYPTALGLQPSSSGEQVYLGGYANATLTFSNSQTPPLFAFAGGTTDAFVAELSSADLSVSLGNIVPYVEGSASTDTTVIPGADLYVPVTVSNAGPDSASEVTVTIQFSAGVTFLRCLAPAVCVSSGSNVIVTYPLLQPGVPQLIPIVAKTNSSLNNQTASINVFVASATSDPSGGNNFQAQAFFVAGVLPFTLSQTDPIDLGTVAVGTSAQANITITPASNTIVDAMLQLTASPGSTPGAFKFLSGTNTSPTISQNPQTITVVFSPLAAVPYSTQVDINADALGVVETVRLIGQGSIVTGPPPPVITQVVDGAGFQPTIAANAWVTLKGSNFMTESTSARSWQGSDFVNGALPTKLDGISVSINGVPAYVAYISPTQINVLAPRDPFSGTVKIDLTAGTGSAEATAPKDILAPGFFTFNAAGTYAVCTRGAQPVGDQSSPVHAGDRITMYLSGLGDTTPAYPNATVVQGVVQLNNTPILTIGGVPATITYFGMTPGVAGLYQLNVTVPQVGPGDQPITLAIAGRNAHTPLYLFVQ